MGSEEATDLDSLVDRLRGPEGPAVARSTAEALLGTSLQEGRVVGLGWATVDIERTLTDGGYPASGAPVRDVMLGASSVVVMAGGLVLVVLEPDTEGRLAAFLARHGEGLCAAYVEVPDLEGWLRPTPLGRLGRVRAHVDPWGPFRIDVSPGSETR